MRFVIQRVTRAEVTVGKEVTGAIGKGFAVLIGIGQEDTPAIADKMVKKLIGMRIFEDAQGKTNLALSDVGGGLLLISQFTLYANCRKGNRPSFTDAGEPAQAERLYEYIVSACRRQVSEVQTGRFGAEMQVSLVNDGPFTILLDSEQLSGA